MELEGTSPPSGVTFLPLLADSSVGWGVAHCKSSLGAGGRRGPVRRKPASTPQVSTVVATSPRMLRQNLLCRGIGRRGRKTVWAGPPTKPCASGSHPAPASVPEQAGRQAPQELSVLLLLERRSKWVGRTSCDLKTLEHFLGVPGES